MSVSVIPMVHQGGGAFRALPRFAGLCDEQFGAGEVLIFEHIEDRSIASHRHEFAWLREAWANLPEHLAAEYKNPEVLRKRALIATGWCSVKDYVCISKIAARRMAATLQEEVDDYTVVIVSERVVRVCKARSQAKNKMKKADFEESKRDVLNFVAALLQVEPQRLEQQAGEPLRLEHRPQEAA